MRYILIIGRAGGSSCAPGAKTVFYRKRFLTPASNFAVSSADNIIMTTILGKTPKDDNDIAVLVSALKDAAPQQADKIVSDGDIDSREAVDIFLFDCDKNGEITEADTLSKCVETNPLLGKVVSVLQRHGMELEEKDVPQLMAKAKRSMAEGMLDNAVSLYKQAFAVTSDRSIKRDILKDLGACEALRLNDVSTPHEDLPHILRQAERFSKAALAIEPEASLRSSSTIRFNLGQIYYVQYHQLKKSDPRQAAEKLAKAAEQFEIVLGLDHGDEVARARLRSCNAGLKVSKFIGADLMNNLMKNLVENEAASEDVKTYVIADLVIELSRKMGNSVAEATSDFLQANIEYRPDRSGNDKDVFKSPAQLLKDGWGDCDDWFHFSYSVLQQAGVEQFALIIPKLPRSQVGHIANLYRGADRNFCVLDNSGIVCLNTNNAEEALKRYADSWRLGDEELDWKTIQLQEVSPSGSK